MPASADFSILYWGHYWGHYWGQDLFLSHFFDKCVTEILVLVGFPEWLLNNGNAPFGIKAVVLRLAVREIAKLIGEDLCLTYLCIYIAMRVPINPIINPRIGDIVTQLNRKSPIDSASLEFGRSA